MNPLGHLPAADFTEEYACLGFWVKIHVYAPCHTIGIIAQHHSGKSLGLKLFGDGMDTKNLHRLRGWIREWLDESGIGPRTKKVDPQIDEGPTPV